MCYGSPSAYLLWSILSVFFFIFLLSHLWTYDRFQCVKWNAARPPGAFKRLMTYSYLVTLPLLVVFNISVARIKYKEGYALDASGQLVPTPCFAWHPAHRRWLLPLYFCLSVAWGLEIVTHLEELTFWLFLLHQGPSQRQWFRSWEFRMWYIGSTIAVIGMPTTTLLSRKDLSSAWAWILLTGSLASTCTTICFLYVLARFPDFIQHVKAEGAEPTVVVRLATFYQLNQIRVVFRFIFTIPFLIIAADGIQAPYHVVENLFALDLLLMVGAIGCVVSSAITLFVFFPRSIAQETGYKVQLESVRTPSFPPHFYQDTPKNEYDAATYDSIVSMRQAPSGPLHRSHSLCSCSVKSDNNRTNTDNDNTPYPMIPSVIPKARSVPSRVYRQCAHMTTIARRHSDGANFEDYTSAITATHLIQAAPPPEHARRTPQVLPYLMNFTSHIDLFDESKNPSRSSARSVT